MISTSKSSASGSVAVRVTVRAVSLRRVQGQLLNLRQCIRTFSPSLYERPDVSRSDSDPNPEVVDAPGTVAPIRRQRRSGYVCISILYPGE